MNPEPSNPLLPLVQQSLTQLLDYCRKNNWAGHDPYDALNSQVFNAVPFFQNYPCRLVFTQAMKRLPVNLRPLFLVSREQNPKGLALFISTLVRLQEINLFNDKQQITSLINRLIELRSPDMPHYCWGYNFDWQGRHGLTPKFSPNIICTSFAANAFLDAFDKYKNSEYLDIAVSAGRFLLTGLEISKEATGLCFSYTTVGQSKVHNANLLGAALLARLYKATGEQEFLDYSSKAMSYSVSRQNSDGSWFYGEHATQKWIDNFHTGFNLGAIKRFCEYTGNTEYLKNIQKGYAFFKKHFFTSEAIPKYFHNRLYPIDIHSVAQSIITLVEMKDIDQNAMQTLEPMLFWTMKNMRSKQGYFYFQKKRYFTNRNSYMRWSQAWMLYGLAILMKELGNK